MALKTKRSKEYRNYLLTYAGRTYEIYDANLGMGTPYWVANDVATSNEVTWSTSKADLLDKLEDILKFRAI